jgi:hypothetical protein
MNTEAKIVENIPGPNPPIKAEIVTAADGKKNEPLGRYPRSSQFATIEIITKTTAIK